MKGQLFIVITVFLVGLLSSVQLFLSVYSEVDMSATLRDNDYHLIKNVRDNVQYLVDNVDDCTELDTELENYKHYLSEVSTRKTYGTKFSYNVTCSPRRVSFIMNALKKSEESLAVFTVS
jgi:hypothetical protein